MERQRIAVAANRCSINLREDLSFPTLFTVEDPHAMLASGVHNATTDGGLHPCEVAPPIFRDPGSGFGF